MEQKGNTAPADLTFTEKNGTLNVGVKPDKDALSMMLTHIKTGERIELALSDQAVIDKIKTSDSSVAEITLDLPTSILTEDNQKLISIQLEEALFTAALTANKDIRIRINREDGKELYSWGFKGADLAASRQSMQDVNLSLTVEKLRGNAALNQIISEDNTNGAVIHFDHDGMLPAQAFVRVYVGNEIQNNKVYVYHYNSETRKLDTLPYSSDYTVDSDGYLQINILHCSDYVILNREADAKAMTSLRNQITVTPGKKTIYLGNPADTKTSLILKLPATLELVTSLKDKTSGSAVGAVTATYQSGNTKIAAVDKNGIITAKGVGTTTILTTVILYSNKKITFSTTVTVKKPFIQMGDYITAMKIGDSFVFTAEAYGLDESDPVWTTSKKSIIVINAATGKATAVSKGTDFVKVKIGDLIKEIKVIVK